MREARIQIEQLLDPLLAQGCRVISVTGSGGKTTLIRRAALHYAASLQVGVAASTKMQLPDEQWYDGGLRPAVAAASDACSEEPGGHGAAGVRRGASICFYADHLLPSGKLWEISGRMLERALTESQLLLIEADGSARKPLKGWRADEPVILPQTQATIGVVPLHCLGQRIDDGMVHRMEAFTALTGLCRGDVMTEAAYVRLILHPEGLFGHAQGMRVLVMNRVDRPELYAAAERIAGRIDFLDDWIAGCLENG